MPLYLQAPYDPDYYKIISGVTLDVTDDVFGEESTAYSLAKDYFEAEYTKGKTFTNTYGIPSSIVYVPFNYNSGASSVNAASINGQTLGTVIISTPYIKTLFNSTLVNASGPSYLIKASG